MKRCARLEDGDRAARRREVERRVGVRVARVDVGAVVAEQRGDLREVHRIGLDCIASHDMTFVAEQRDDLRRCQTDSDGVSARDGTRRRRAR